MKISNQMELRGKLSNFDKKKLCNTGQKSIFNFVIKITKVSIMIHDEKKKSLEKWFRGSQDQRELFY